MAQVNVVKPRTLIAGSPEARFINRGPDQMGAVEIVLMDFAIRFTTSEWDYLVQEIVNDRAAQANR